MSEKPRPAAQTVKPVKKAGGVFKRVFIKDGKLRGAILLGDTEDYAKLQDLMKKNENIPNPQGLIGG